MGWRFKCFLSEYDYYRYGKSGKFGYFSKEEIISLEDRKILHEKVITGKAGTLILVDTRGLHSDTPLIDGPRVMLANYFDVTC